jgi:anthranilate phosphoribosyltransferase
VANCWASTARAQRLYLLGTPTAQARPVVLPAYGGARTEHNLLPLLGLLLRRLGVPVLFHGTLEGSGRLASVYILREFGVLPSASLLQAQATLDAERIAFLPTAVLCPGLATLLAMRNRLGVRNSAHLVAKLLDPFDGNGLLVIGASCPQTLDKLGGVLLDLGASALLLTSTEGEPFASPRRRPRIEHFQRGVRQLLFEEEAGPVRPVAGLPAGIDAHATAQWMRLALAGEAPIPHPLVNQLACCLYACGYTDDMNQAKAIAAMEAGSLAPGARERRAEPTAVSRTDRHARLPDTSPVAPRHSAGRGNLRGEAALRDQEPGRDGPWREMRGRCTPCGGKTGCPLVALSLGEAVREQVARAAAALHLGRQDGQRRHPAGSLRTQLGWRRSSTAAQLTAEVIDTTIRLPGIIRTSSPAHTNGSLRGRPGPTIYSPYGPATTRGWPTEQFDVNRFHPTTSFEHTRIRAGPPGRAGGNQRFIGDYDFAQMPQMLDGVTVNTEAIPRTKITYGYFWRVRNAYAVDWSTSINAGSVSYEVVPEKLKVGAYGAFQNQQRTGSVTGFADNSNSIFGGCV